MTYTPDESERRVIEWLREQAVSRGYSGKTLHELIMLTYAIETGDHRND